MSEASTLEVTHCEEKQCEGAHASTIHQVQVLLVHQQLEHRQQGSQGFEFILESFDELDGLHTRLTVDSDDCLQSSFSVNKTDEGHTCHYRFQRVLYSDAFTRKTVDEIGEGGLANIPEDSDVEVARREV